MTWTGLQMRAAPPGSPDRLAPRSRRDCIHYATDGRDILFNSPGRVGGRTNRGLWWTDGDGTFGNPPPGADGSSFLTSLPAVVPLHVDHLRHDRRAALGRVPGVRAAGRPRLGFRTPRRCALTPGWSTPPHSSRCG